MNKVVYLSRQTYHKELETDADYDDVKSKKERFPQISSNVPNFSKIRMSETGRYSVSKLEESTITSNEIIMFYKNFVENVEISSISITDATSNAGGNSINFALNRMHVNAIELSKKEFQRLKDNVQQYNLNNISLYNGNSLDLIYSKKVNQDIVYFDPPWGGPTYKNFKFVGLSLGTDGEDVYNHIEKMLEGGYCKCVVLKGPFNTFIKNTKYLDLVIDVKIKKNTTNKINNYYNLYFFSLVQKNIINSFYEKKQKKESLQININPFSTIGSSYVKAEKTLTFNDKWRIFNLSYLLFEMTVPEYIYEQTEHELTEKQFVYHCVNDYFVKNRIENVYYSQCRELALFINQTGVNEIIALFSLPTDLKMKQIVRQFCMLFMIDRIVVEKKSISFEPSPIEYNDFTAIVNGIEYNTKNFIDGMYLLPEILPKITIDRVEHLSSFVLTNKA